MNLLSWLPVDQFSSGSFAANDTWGFTSPRGRKYAILGLSHGTGFVDITEPRSPVIVADIPDTDSIWSDFKVYWPYVYNGNESGGGIQVIDVSQIDPPMRSVTLLSTLTQQGLQTTHTIALNPDSGFLYLNGSNLGGGRLVAVSLADPGNPQIVGTAPVGGYVHDSQIVTYTTGPYAGREIAFCHNGGAGLRILDVTNKSNMFLLSTLSYPNLSYTHQGWLTTDRRYLIFNDELEELNGLVSNTTVYVADVQNLSLPFLAATFTHPTGCWIDHDLHVRENRVYQAQYGHGMSVLDIGNPLAPTEVAYFDTHPEDNPQDFVGMWGSFAGFPTRVVIGSDMERGLFVLCDEPEKPLAGFVLDRPSACLGELVTFDAGSSTHCTPARSLVAYEWDFDYDGLNFDVDATGLTTQHGYPQSGVHAVALRVTDDTNPAHTDISALTVTVTECSPAPPNIVWNPDPLSPDRTTRSLRFRVEGKPNGSLEDAIRVTMVDLMHPDPRNLTQYPPPDFTTFDTGTYGTCAGATTAPNFNGHRCAADADCLGPNMGITTDDGTCSLPGPVCTGEGVATNANLNQGSCARWVSKPGTFYETQGPPQSGPYRASRLQCTPVYYDWKSEPGGQVTVVGAEILPSSEYSVQAYVASCMGNEATCMNASAPVTMYTRRKGDLDDLYQTPSPDALTQANAIDVAQSVNAVKHILGAPSHARAQMQPNLPDLNTDCNVLDIVEVVDSLKRTAYSFSGPCPCPSTVTCGGSCTGCAGMCVKTCTSGDNIGEPCINNNHCPNGACAATGTCRDRCGRCSP